MSWRSFRALLALGGLSDEATTRRAMVGPEGALLDALNTSNDLNQSVCS